MGSTVYQVYRFQDASFSSFLDINLLLYSMIVLSLLCLVYLVYFRKMSLFEITLNSRRFYQDHSLLCKIIIGLFLAGFILSSRYSYFERYTRAGQMEVLTPFRYDRFLGKIQWVPTDFGSKRTWVDFHP